MHSRTFLTIIRTAFASLWLGLFISASATTHLDQLQEGDILFTGSKQGQARAIIGATGSSHTHCGIAVMHQGRLMVLEAVQPVRFTPLDRFIAAGSPGSFSARRYTGAITPEAYRKAREWALSQIGRDYDGLFAWSDDRMYCSELVWKIYQKAGVELCQPRKFRDYNLRHPEVVKLINQRYGGMSRVPLDEKVVAPSDLAASPLLFEVSAQPTPPRGR
jgi:hypothetical protein